MHDRSYFAKKSSPRVFDAFMGLLMICIGLVLLALFGLPSLGLALGMLFDASALRVPGQSTGARLAYALEFSLLFIFSAGCIWRGCLLLLAERDVASVHSSAGERRFAYKAGRACGGFIRALFGRRRNT